MRRVCEQEVRMHRLSNRQNTEEIGSALLYIFFFSEHRKPIKLVFLCALMIEKRTESTFWYLTLIEKVKMLVCILVNQENTQTHYILHTRLVQVEYIP